MANKKKKTTLKEMGQVDGQTTAHAKYRSIDDILGERQHLFGCNTIEAYEAKIDDMDMADLQEHALDLELRPIDNRSVLKDRLLNEFRKRLSKYTGSAVQESSVIENPSKVNEIKKLLAGGK